jgi:cell division protease FtsH
MIVGLLGGRAAEELVFDTVTTGASNDIERATGIARSMVTQYGMSKRFGLMGLETVESQYLDRRAALNCSDVTAAAIDDEVMKILKKCYKEAKTMLRDNRKVMDKIAAHLIEKETITGKEFMKIYRREKGIPEPEETKETKEKETETRETEIKETETQNKETETTERDGVHLVLTGMQKDESESGTGDDGKEPHVETGKPEPETGTDKPQTDAVQENPESDD